MVGRAASLRRSWALGLVATSLCGLATPAPAGAGDVAVLLSARVDAYSDALRGFKASLRGHRVVETYDMEGDAGRGTRLLGQIESKEKPDLIFAVGVWALKATLEAPPSTPVVYAMVLNPESVVGGRSANVTGASMNVSVAESLRLLRKLGPQIKRVGLVYSKDKTGYLVDEAKALAAGLGIELVARSASSPGKAMQAGDSIQKAGIDAYWYLPDEMMLAAPVSKHVFLTAHRHGIPILGMSERQAQMGALLTLSFASSKDIGSQAGELANSILAGRRTSEIPGTSAREVSLTVNLKTARKLGVTIPESILVAANELIK
jgi:putative ABC transport system substrate-binding protein